MCSLFYPVYNSVTVKNNYHYLYLKNLKITYKDNIAKIRHKLDHIFIYKIKELFPSCQAFDYKRDKIGNN